ncbi:MAG: ribose-phosphate diphosphokinase [Gammaproteobacteria bacterium]
MTESLLVLGFPEYSEQARRLADALDAPCEMVDTHRFPDGESRIRLPAHLPRQVVVCRSLNDPDRKLVELILTAATARELGASTLTLVSPYLCYMRQDMAFQPGEAVSQRIVGRLLADHFDEVITVDPHLHRVSRLEEAVPTRRALALSAAGEMGRFLQARVDRPLLLGPDSESLQWVRAIAAPAGLEYGVAEKERLGDRSVRIILPTMDFRRREVILVDDMASTGHTLAAAARQVLAAGASRVRVLVAHALLVDDALEQIERAGITDFWSTDSVPHASNVIGLADLLARAVRGA